VKAEEDAHFSAFVAAQSGRLVHLAELLCGDRHRAEDLVQSALIRTYMRWDRIEGDDPFGYVRQAVVNANRDWWRRKQWREVAAGDLPEPPPTSDFAGHVDHRASVLRALSTLTRKERNVVVLRFYEDLDEQGTAQVLDMARGTVKSTCARALRKLRLSPELTDELAKGAP
jgi:RNA polymerase sigma-70 factor (sigma-E family)